MLELPVEDLLARVDAIPPLPEVAQQLMQMTEDGEASAGEIGAVVARDASITARLLSIANSPIYAPSVPVTGLPRAVMLIGNAGIFNLVVGICAASALRPRRGSEQVHEFLWSHSIAVATLSEELGRRAGLEAPEELFTAGMFTDIGYLAVSTLLPGGVGQQLFHEVAMGDFEPAEIAEFSAQCEAIGRRALAVWELPERLRRLCDARGTEAALGRSQEAHARGADAAQGRSQDVRARGARAALTRSQHVLALARALIECKGFWFYVPSEAGSAAARKAAALGLGESDLVAALGRMRGRFEAVSKSLDCDGVLLHPQGEDGQAPLLLAGAAAEPELDVERVLLADCGLAFEACELEELVERNVRARKILVREHSGDLTRLLEFARGLLARGAERVFLLGLADQLLRIQVPEGPGQIFALPLHPRVSDLHRARLLPHAPLRQGSLRDVLQRHLS